MKKGLFALGAGLVLTLCVPAAAQTDAQEEISAVVLTADSFGEVAEVNDEQEASLRIVLKAQQPDSDYGAQSIVTYPEYERCYLQYADEASLEAGYAAIISDYGEDACYIDQEVDASDVLLESSSDDDPSYSWGVAYMGMDSMRDLDLSDDFGEITVAVIDTGIVTDNAIFADQPVDSDSYDFTASTSVLTDTNGHGTHVAGIIADCCPSNVNLMVLRVFDEDDKATISNVESALLYAVSHGADLINMSLGFETKTASTYDFLDDAVSQAADAEIPVVCAAGNSSLNVNTMYPACLTDTIAVSAIDSDGAFASDYSNYGSLIDFTAPGSQITGAWNDGGTKVLDGTSMACPHLTSVLAYLKMVWPDDTVSGLYDRAVSYSEDYGDKGKDIYYGNGCPVITDLITEDDLYDPNDVDISDYHLVLKSSTYYYKGSAVEPDVTVYGSMGILTEGTDYKVIYENNEGPGTGTVTVKGIGHYAGRITKNFKILEYKPLDLKSSNTDSGISLSWSALSGADYYVVSRSKNGADYKDVATTEDTSYTDESVYAGNTYSYRIIAHCADDDTMSDPSDVSEIVRMTAPSFTVTNRKGCVKVKWSESEGASGYGIYRKAEGESSWTRIATVKSGLLYYKDTTVDSGSSYTYMVKAYAKVSNGTVYSTHLSGKTIVYLDQPSVTAPAVSGGIKVKWQKVSGASGYIVMRKDKGASSWTRLAKLSDPSAVSYKDYTVVNGKYYDYTVKAYLTVSGTSYLSGYDDTLWTCYLEEPEISYLSNSSKGTVTVSWNRNQKASGYQISYTTDTDFSSASVIKVSSGSQVSGVISGLKRGNTCSIRVRALIRQDGKTCYSAWSSVKSIQIKK